MKHTNNQSNEDSRKDLRKNGTSAEATLWKMLKARQIEGCKFRRQFSVGPFILDFYCPQKQLAIELDGAPHFAPGGYMSDEKRTQYLNRQGIEVLRFENKDIFEQTIMVRSAIVEAILNRPNFFNSSPV